MFPNAQMTVKRHFLAGILVFVPLALTFFSVTWIDESVTLILDRLFLLLPEPWNPERFVPSQIPGLGIVLTLALIYLVGVFASIYLGRRIVWVYEHVLQTIPGVRWFYAVSKQFLEGAFRLMRQFEGGSDRFHGVVLLEYPRKGIYSLAFVTGEGLAEVTQKTGVEMVSVFIPTAPNPTSGFFLLAPKADVTMLDMPVEKAFRLIVSAGMAGDEHPEEEVKTKSPLLEGAGEMFRRAGRRKAPPNS